MPLLVLASSLLAGIVLGAHMAPPPLLLLGLALAAALAAFVVRRDRTALLRCVGCGALLLGVVRYDHHAATLDASPLLTVTGSFVQLTGVVDEEPEARPTGQRVTIAVSEVQRGNERWLAPAGRVQVTLPRLPEQRYGDLLRLRGWLAPATNFSEEFDYRSFLYRRGVLATMSYPAAELQATGAGLGWRAALLGLRQWLAAALDRQLPEPQGALVKGILLGIRTDIPPDLVADFRTTGTAHIIAISGQNLSIAAGLAVLLGRRLLGRRHPLFALTLFGCVWGYALLVGMPLSVLRAAVMATLMLAAALVGRQNSGLPALLGAAALMAALDPFAPWDLGFQLSFLAMGGILFLTPLLLLAARRRFRRAEETVPEGWGASLADAGVTGMAGVLGATVAALPVALLNFPMHPFTALPTTLVAVPALPVILLAGALASISGGLAAGIAGFLAGALNAAAWLGATIAYFAATWLITVVQAAAGLPLAAVPVARPPEWAAWLYGAALAYVTATAHRRYALELRWGDDAARRPSRRPRLDWRKGTVAAAGVLAAGLWLGNPAWAIGDGRLHVWALDVGAGDAALLRAPGGTTVLVDGGPDPAALQLALARILPFWERRIQWGVLTAPQRDRTIGLRDVAARFQLGGIIEGPGGATTAEYRDWERLLAARGIPRLRLSAGDSVELEPGTVLEAFAAPALPRSGTPAGSVALRVASPAGDVLLLGDGSGGITEAVIARSDDRGPVRAMKLHQRPPGADVLPALLEALEPGMLVLTGAGDLPPGATGNTLVERTQDRGTVEIVLGPEGGWVRSER